MCSYPHHHRGQDLHASFSKIFRGSSAHWGSIYCLLRKESEKVEIEREREIASPRYENLLDSRKIVERSLWNFCGNALQHLGHYPWMYNEEQKLAVYFPAWRNLLIKVIWLTKLYLTLCVSWYHKFMKYLTCSVIRYCHELLNILWWYINIKYYKEEKVFHFFVIIL